jgi:hypothetical protein
VAIDDLEAPVTSLEREVVGLREQFALTSIDAERRQPQKTPSSTQASSRDRGAGEGLPAGMKAAERSRCRSNRTD